MTTTAQPDDNSIDGNSRFIAATAGQALATVEAALGAEPSAMKEQVDVAERAVARLRDGLIERGRTTADAGVAARLQPYFPVLFTGRGGLVAHE